MIATMLLLLHQSLYSACCRGLGTGGHHTTMMSTASGASSICEPDTRKWGSLRASCIQIRSTEDENSHITVENYVQPVPGNFSEVHHGCPHHHLSSFNNFQPLLPYPTWLMGRLENGDHLAGSGSSMMLLSLPEPQHYDKAITPVGVQYNVWIQRSIKKSLSS